MEINKDYVVFPVLASEFPREGIELLLEGMIEMNVHQLQAFLAPLFQTSLFRRARNLFGPIGHTCIIKGGISPRSEFHGFEELIGGKIASMEAIQFI
ncbi:MAG: hypothetical protein ACE5R6_16535 [Candidatus Heimdallarchaeota archaeon]